MTSALAILIILFIAAAVAAPRRKAAAQARLAELRALGRNLAV